MKWKAVETWGIKSITILMALIIVYISVAGFMSLLGGTAGTVIGGIFGLAELAFILYFPSTIGNWKTMSFLSKSALMVVIVALGTLSFASTHSFITKNISGMTQKADKNIQDLSILENKKIDNVDKIKRYQLEKEELFNNKKEASQKVIDALKIQKLNSDQVRVIIFNKGRPCVKDCQDRKLAGERELQFSIDRVNDLKKEKQVIIDNINSKIQLIDQSEMFGIDITKELYKKKEHELTNKNAKKLYAGYEAVGSKVNSIFGIISDPIETFTAFVSLILYSLYILLTIWLYGIIHRQKKRSISTLWKIATYLGRKKQKQEETNELKKSRQIIDRIEQYFGNVWDVKNFVDKADVSKAENEYIEEEYREHIAKGKLDSLKRSNRFWMFISTIAKYLIGLTMIVMVTVVILLGLAKIANEIEVPQVMQEYIRK